MLNCPFWNLESTSVSSGNESCLLSRSLFFSPKASQYLGFLLLGSPYGYRQEFLALSTSPSTQRQQDMFNPSNFIGHFTELFLNI